MNTQHQIPLRNFIPLAVLGLIALAIGVFVPVVQLIVPSAIYLAGSLGIISSLYLRLLAMKRDRNVPLLALAINGVLTAALSFLVIKTIADLIQ